jgi:fructokinase
MIPLQGANGEQGYAPLAGGALLNTAIALGRLGVNVGIISGISTDLFGERLVRALQDSHVCTDLLIRSTLPTTLAFVQLDDGHASYTFYDENSAGRSVEEAQLPTLPDAVSTLYLGGISLISEPGADSYCALAEREHGKCIIVLDPNIRTTFIEDELRYRSRLERLMAVADIIKVSDEDLDWLVPGDIKEDDKVASLGGDSCLVIITKGNKDAVAYLPNGNVVLQAVPKVKVVDTVGAGDTFNAGFMAQLVTLGQLTKTNLPNMDEPVLQAAMGYATQVAAVTVSRAGANPPWLSEL